MTITDLNKNHSHLNKGANKMEKTITLELTHNDYELLRLATFALEKDRKENILTEREKIQNGKHFDGELWDRYRQIDQDVYFDIMAFRSKLIESASGQFDYDQLTKYDNQFSK
jgi:hypothetical protein